jgi:23S rRNA (guanosine2251-2'-O)-methyltransferase
LEKFALEKDKKYAFIFGHEVKGVQQEIVNNSDFCVEIPQFGTKHSLNISVSAGVVLWEMFKKSGL